MFSERIGIPPNAPSLVAAAAWQIIMTVSSHREAAETLWRQALLQAVVSGGRTQESFDAVSSAFRRYRETDNPWLEKVRQAEEKIIREAVQELAKTPLTITVDRQEARLVKQGKKHPQLPKLR